MNETKKHPQAPVLEGPMGAVQWGQRQEKIDRVTGQSAKQGKVGYSP